MKILIGILAAVILYSAIGTGYNVDAIQKLAPTQMKSRNWKIIRYEGYQWGAWQWAGGACWYHVANIDNPNVQYRVAISMWRGQLFYWYGAPENLSRFEVKVNE